MQNTLKQHDRNNIMSQIIIFYENNKLFYCYTNSIEIEKCKYLFEKCTIFLFIKIIYKK